MPVNEIERLEIVLRDSQLHQTINIILEVVSWSSEHERHLCHVMKDDISTYKQFDRSTLL